MFGLLGAWKYTHSTCGEGQERERGREGGLATGSMDEKT